MDPTAEDPALLAGRYRLGELLGRGGMAVVYAAFDERLARPVAVKILQPTGGDDTGMRARFDREARSVAQLTHPAIVGVYDSGEDRGRAYLVMERLPGETLADRMRAGPVEAAWLVPIAADVLGALGAAHSLGLVHRDIKPANILLTADGRAKVADFGIAKTYLDDAGSADVTGGDLTATGLILGTVAYLSPEQIDGAPASPQADIYAVGVLLYEALSGRKPYVGDNPIAQARAATEGRAADLMTIRPGIDPRVAAVVRRAMARRLQDRYPSAAAMLSDLVATGLVGREGTAALPGGADTMVVPVAGEAATTVVSRTPSPPPVVPSQAAAAPSRASAVPAMTDHGDRRRIILIAAVAALAVIVVLVAVVLVVLSRSTASTTIDPATTVTTASTTVTTLPAATPTTALAPATTTPTTTAPTTVTTTAPSTTAPPTTTTVPATTTTVAPTTTQAPTTTAPSSSG